MALGGKAAGAIYLLAAGAAALVPALSHGVFRSYIHSPDPDIIFAYQPLLLNDGDRQINAEHTGYVYFVLFAWVLRVARVFGLIGADRVSGLMTVDGATFDTLYAQIIYTGRLFSMIEALVLVALVFFGARMMTRSITAAGVAALVTAFSLGTAVQAMLLRTELSSAVFVHAALFALIAAARASGSRAILLLGLTGLLSALAAAAKVQAILVLLFLPAMALLVGHKSRAEATEIGPQEARILTGLLGLLAALVTLPAAIMLVSGIIERGSGGYYQLAIAIYILAAAALYRWIYDVPTIRWVAGLAALLLGFSAGILLHLLYRNPAATDAMAAFIEHMKVYSGEHIALSQGIPVDAMLAALWPSLGNVITHRLNPFAHPYNLLEIAIVGGAIWAWRLGAQRRAVSALAFLAAAMAVEILFGLRGFPQWYHVYPDPWRAIAFALLFDTIWQSLPDMRRAAATGVTLAAVLAMGWINVSRAMDPRFSQPQAPAAACGQAKYYMPKLSHQFAKFC